MYIIIPSYEPDRRLVDLVSDIRQQMSDTIIVVDDGSGPNYVKYFEAVENLDAVLLTHDKNRGKGAALKTAFNYIADNYQNDDVMVTIDSDGQHLIPDMIKVARWARQDGKAIVLGVRSFSGDVPLRSRIGNEVTALLFGLVTGKKIKDIQTGLRGLSTEMLPWLLTLDGDRFEYEFNMLLEANKAGYDLAEVAIETVYLEDNKSSHFRPIRDSIRIYSPFFKFSGTAILSALIDALALFLLMAMTNNLLLSVVAARLISASCQCLLNANYVFRSSNPLMKTIVRYFVLVAVILSCNYFMLKALVGLGIGLVIAKLLTETILFILSYRVQRQYVFI